jgi:hypothetical protein
MRSISRCCLVAILRRAGVLEAGDPVAFIDHEEEHHAEEKSQDRQAPRQLSAASGWAARAAKHAGGGS